MTKMNARVPYNVEIAAHGQEALDSIEAAGGHFGRAEATEVSLAQVDAETEAVPDGIQRLNLKVPYNLQMAIHG